VRPADDRRSCGETCPQAADPSSGDDPEPSIVSQLLETAFVTFTDGYLASQIASMMRSRTDDAAVLEEISRQEVAAYLAEADASTGMAKQTHLQNAIKIARARGLTDMARQATAQLQAIPVKELGLKSSSWSIRMPRDQVERFLDAFVASPDWRDGLRFFLRTGCPSGDLSQLRDQQRDLGKVTVLPAWLRAPSWVPTACPAGPPRPRQTARRCSWLPWPASGRRTRAGSWPKASAGW
jgi:hypothetical protein